MSRQRITQVSHIHECIINEMLLTPTITQQELCQIFGYSAGWMCRIIGSDAFKARLAERRKELIDPQIKSRINHRIEAATNQAVEQIQRKLDASESADLALQSLGVLAQALHITSPVKK